MMSTLDEPKDGPDAEESGLAPAYTYFGQFVDHDLTFDPVSTLQRQNDPDALVDFRTPRFDLDNVYGRGPDDQPYLYLDSRRFLQGTPLTGTALGAALTAHDLPRSAATSIDPMAKNRAIIGDPRNDENVIVSQLQGLMLRLHNRIATQNPTWPFAQVQQEVRFHYQWVVLNDFQLAYKIDTSLVDPLKDLPRRVAGDPPPGLAARNLLRGWRLRLPSGQDVARAMGLEPISDIEIGKFTGTDPTTNIQHHPRRHLRRQVPVVDLCPGRDRGDDGRRHHQRRRSSRSRPASSARSAVASSPRRSLESWPMTPARIST